ncbi:MAG: hypothetical protein AAF721_12945 [Myxococcota bacterium]
MIAVRRPWLAKHREEARAVVRGLCDATLAYRKDEDPSLALIAKHLGNADVDGAARERYRLSGPSLLSMPPRAEADSLQAVLDLMGDASTDPASIIDGTIVDEVVAEGHCR